MCDRIRDRGRTTDRHGSTSLCKVPSKSGQTNNIDTTVCIDIATERHLTAILRERTAQRGGTRHSKRTTYCGRTTDAQSRTDRNVIGCCYSVERHIA